MPNLFILDVKTDPKENRVEFRLSDGEGTHLGANQSRLKGEDASLWEGLFDTRDHVERYALDNAGRPDRRRAGELLERIGVFLGSWVLGEEIIGRLHEGFHQRTLIIRLPAPEDDALAAAFARAPWEIARPGEGLEPLFARNLAVRAVTGTDRPEDREAPLSLEPDEALRALLIFAEAPGSRPLAMRLERQRLLDLFYEDIMPDRQVQVDVLCHGVTRKRIRDQVRKERGYHIVHWSGHGHHDTLELAGADGGRDEISGAKMVSLFREAGGFIPSLVFLSACHSGSLIQAGDWAEMRADLRQSEGQKEARESDLETLLEEKKGYTGTALALLSAGAPQVAAMRYAVGDAYARRLARIFYRGLLAEGQTTDAALVLARTELANDAGLAPEHLASDHATPLLFGRTPLRMLPHKKRSEQLTLRYPHPRQPLLEGELKRPVRFVGRGRELTSLIIEWLPRRSPPLALVQGLAGLGKTALAAEAINLWHHRFDAVLAVQSRGNPLPAEEFYQEIHNRLTIGSKVYRESCGQDEYRNICLPRDLLKGEERLGHMRNNLIDALHAQRILLVIDNFETNLLDSNTCKDPEWKRLLNDLAARLKDAGSRVILTTRHRPAELKEEIVWLPMGPLPMNEAQLFLQSHPDLRKLWHDAVTRPLAVQILEISRGHPLILQRLGDLARDVDALNAALDRLEIKGFEHLPDLVTGARNDDEREAERRYLEDVAMGAVDLLIERLDPAARQLLRVVTLALEPVGAQILKGVWEGNTVEQEQLEQIKMMLALMEKLPPDKRPELPEMPEKFKALLSQDAPPPTTPPIDPLLAQLTESGLLQVEETGATAVYSFHELVRERREAWMANHPGGKEERDSKEIWQAYGERYENLFKELQQSGGSREAATEMGRRALSYLARAEAYDKLGGFAGELVTSTNDPQQLRAIIAELQTIVERAPEGKPRWSARTYLADAFSQTGHLEQALPFYEQAAEEVEEARNWSDVGWICQNWAIALRDAGKLSLARETYQRSAQAKRKSGKPKIDVIGSELETLRIDVMQGQAQKALPEIARRLEKVRKWRQRHEQGERVDEAPNAEMLKRVLVGALDIARKANLYLKQWQDCLDLLSETEEVKKEHGESTHEIARTRFNQYKPLLELGKLTEAQKVLEGCMHVFSKVGDLTNQAKALSALTDIWDKRGDLSRAIELQRQALAVLESLDNPVDRSISHGNLSIYLHKARRVEEGACHILARMVYDVVTGNQNLLQICLRNVTIRVKEFANTSTPYLLPRLTDLLSRSEFSALRRFLEQWKVDIEELQGGIDAIVKQIEGSMENPEEQRP